MAVQTTTDRLYDFLSQNIDDMPDRQSFDASMQDKGSREKLHSFMQKNFDDVPDFEKFDTSLGSRSRTIPEKVVDTASAAVDFISHPKGIKTRDFRQDVQTAGNALKSIPEHMGIKSVSDVPGFVGGAAMSGLYSASSGVVGAARMITEPLNRYVAKPIYEAVTGQPGAETDKINQALGDYQQSIQQSADASIPKDETGIASGIASTTQNLANLPLLLMGGSEAGLGMMAAQTAGQSYGEARGAGVSPGQALVHGASQGAIEWATEKIPVERLLGDLKTNAPLFQTVMHQLSSEIPGEEIATLFQDLNDWATLHPDKPFSEYLAARPSAAAQTLVATVVGSVATGGVAKGSDAVARGAITMAERVHSKLAEKRAQQAQAEPPQVAPPQEPAVQQQAPASRGGLNQAIIQQESGGRTAVVNPKSGATGAFQITKPFLTDANRFLGTSYTMEDMKDPQKAQQVKDAWHQHYTDQFARDNGRMPTDRELAMMHHGGPKGYLRPNVADQEGVTNASYADQVTSRVDQQGQQEQPQVPQAPEQLISEDMQAKPVAGNESTETEPQVIAKPTETAQEAVTPPEAVIAPSQQDETQEPAKKEPWQMTRSEFETERPAVQGYLYHGSPDGDLSRIDPYTHTKNWKEGIGFYSTDSNEKAREYSSGRTAKGDRKVLASQNGRVNYIHGTPKKPLNMDSPVDMSIWTSVAKNLGYDDATNLDAKTNGDAYRELIREYNRDNMTGEGQYAVEEVLTSEHGFDAFQHVEGSTTGHPHNVTIWRQEESLPAIVTPADVHRKEVERAINEGKPVPPDVLADYPGLKKQAAFVKAKEKKQQKIEQAKTSGEIPEGDKPGAYPVGGTALLKGNEVTITTPPYELHGGTFQDAVTADGKVVTIATPKQVSKRTAEQQRQWKEEQAGFGRLSKVPKELDAEGLDSEFLKSAEAAYTHTSNSPSNSAKAELQWVDNAADNLRGELSKHVSDARTVDGAIAEFRKNYMQQRAMVFSVRKSSYSALVAGSSKFNTKQSGKRSSAVDKAEEAFGKWLKDEKRRIHDVTGATEARKKKEFDKAKAESEGKKKADEVVRQEKEAQRKLPIVNQKSKGHTEITKEQWAKTHADYKAIRVSEDGSYRYRSMIVNGSLTPVYIVDQKATAFREWLEGVDGSSEKMDSGSFTGSDSFRQTGTATRMVVIDKRREIDEEKTGNGAVAAYGSESKILAGGKEFGTVRYALLERDDLIVSHTPPYFQPNPKFPQDRQPRDYTNPEIKARTQEIIDNIVKGKFASYFQKNVESETGMPVINLHGVVLSGNNRTMAILSGYSTYAKALADADIGLYGIDTGDIKGMKRPVLVRVFDHPEAEQDFAVESNREMVKPQVAREVVSVYKALSDEKRDAAEKAIRGIYEEFAESGKVKVNEFLSGIAHSELPTMVRTWLKESGILSGSDIQNNQLTSVGQEKIKTLAMHLLNQDIGANKATFRKMIGEDDVTFGIDKAIDLATGPLLRLKESDPNEYAVLTENLGNALDRYTVYRSNPDAYRPGDAHKGDAKTLSSNKAKRGLSVDDEPLTSDQSKLFDALNSPTQSSLKRIVDDMVVGQGALFAAPAAAPSNKRTNPISRDRVSQKRDVNPDEIVKAMEDISGTPIRYGRGWFAQRRAAGWFNMGNDLIRVKTANAMDTVAHEIGHSTHAKIVGWNVKFPDEVDRGLFNLGKALYGDRKPNGGYVREGFAEFFAKKLLGDDTAKSFPAVDKWFEAQVLEQHPDMAKRFKAAQEMYRQWDEQGAIGRVASMVQRVQTGPMGKLKTAYEQLSKMLSSRMWVNDAAQLEKVVDQLMKETGVKLNPTENPATMRAALKMSAPGTARRFIFDHALNIKGDIVGKSLVDYLKPIRDRLEDFTAYAIARRAIDLHARDINPGISLEDAEYTAEQLKSPEFDEALKGVTEWSNHLIDYVVEAGGLSPDAAKAMRDLNPIYVPFKRFFDVRYLGGAKGASSKTHGIKRMKGSGRRIMDPIDILMIQAEQMIRFGNELLVSQAIIKATEKIEGTSTKSNPVSVGWFANKVQAPMAAQSFSAESIRKQLEEIGANLEDADMGKMLQVFSTAYKPTGKDNIIAIWRNGEREFWEVDPEIYRVTMEMDKDHLPYFLTAVFGPAKRLVQLGAVGINAGFGAIKNPIKDTLTRASYGKANSSPIDTIVNGFWEDLKKGEKAELWKNLGGELGTLMGQDRAQARSYLEESLAETKGEKAKQIALHPIDAMRKLFGFYESSPRIAEFKAILKTAEEKYGTGSLDARIEALLASKDVTVNFTRGGIIATALNGMIPFFNARIQGSSKFVREFSGANAVRALGHSVAYITVPSLLLAFINKDEDWYDELPKWERLAFWHFSLDGGKNIVRIPKPPEVGYVLGSVPQELFLSAYKKQPELVADAMWDTLKGFVPVNSLWDLAPALLKPGMEVLSNYDSFRERQIVPDYEKRSKMPKDQFGRYRTETSKWIGEMLNVSPRKIEHVMSGQTGGYATNTIRLAESLVGVRKELGRSGGANELPVVGTLFSRNPYYNGRSVNKMYELREELEQKKGSGSLKSEEREQLMKLEFAAKRISIIKKRGDAGQMDTDEAAKKITSIARRSIGLDALQ